MIKLPKRENITNKGDAGRVLVIGGDVGMAGAVAFSAESAYRTGTGLVEVSSHPENRTVLQALIPEAIFSEWGKESLDKASAVVIGVGMGKSNFATRLLERVLVSAKCPVVIDADALNLMSENRDLFSLLSENTVVTPHVAELSRLAGKPVRDLEKETSDFAKEYKTYAVGKSNISFIAFPDGSALKHDFPNPTLSKGGSGDILTGIIASLLAEKIPMNEALPLALSIHSEIGKLAREKYGERGAIARDIIREIPNVVKTK